MRDGMDIAWVQCLINNAITIAEQGSINLDWTKTRVELLKKRPVQRFRCWKFGHVRQKCNETVDRTGNCFKCGSGSHQAQKYEESPHCVICAAINKPFGHRIGSAICLAYQGIQVGATTRPTALEARLRRTSHPEEQSWKSIFCSNLNHSWKALDLLKHQLCELDMDACIIAE